MVFAEKSLNGQTAWCGIVPTWRSWTLGWWKAWSLRKKHRASVQWCWLLGCPLTFGKYLLVPNFVLNCVNVNLLSPRMWFSVVAGIKLSVSEPCSRCTPCGIVQERALCCLVLSDQTNKNDKQEWKVQLRSALLNGTCATGIFSGSGHQTSFLIAHCARGNAKIELNAAFHN